ncbi:MAG: hypothetical protein EB051_04810 [Chlamydiia bacterium]|nr:hypothetical protein [Chlamydiia bacterium]
MNKKNKPHIFKSKRFCPTLIEGLISILRNKMKEMNVTKNNCPNQDRTIIKEIIKLFMPESDIQSMKNEESIQNQNQIKKER